MPQCSSRGGEINSQTVQRIESSRDCFIGKDDRIDRHDRQLFDDTCVDGRV